MAPDYSVNTEGPAFESTQEFLIMYIYSPAFLYNLSISDTLSSDFTGQPAKQDSFRCPCKRLRTINLGSINNNHYLYYHHETCTWMRIKHDIRWSSRTTPYLHPYLLNDLKERKLRYHRQGKKPRQTLSLLQTPLLVRSHLYWGSRLMRVPSYKVRIHQRTSRKYWAQEHFKGM